MDTSKYIKKCPRCGTKIESDRSKGDRATIIFIENDHDMNQWFKNKCSNPKCGIEWKETIHTNDNPDDPSWMMNALY